MRMLKRQLCLAITICSAACSTNRLPSSNTSLELMPGYIKTSAGDSIVADTGRLIVRENRQRAGSRDVAISVLVLRGTGQHNDVPTIYVSGGSGAGTSAVRGPRFPFFDSMRELGPVIAFDIRGTGRSTPVLTCNARLSINLAEPLTRTALVEATRSVNRLCGDSLRARGFDLAGYNGREVAEDIEDLRRALGAEQIRLLGTSTGSHLALEYLRKYPKRVAAAYMLGTEGPGQTDHLPSGADSAFIAFSRIAQSAVGSAASLVEQAQRVIRTLRAHPATVSGVRVGGATQDVAFGAYDVQLFIASTLGERTQLAQLPQMLATMNAGRFEPLAALKVQALQNPFQSPWESLHDCQAGSSPERHAAVRREALTALLDHATLDFAEACAAWGVAELPTQYRRAVRSSVPTLFVSGTLDGRTPVANAEEVMAGFRDAAHLVVEGISHGDDLFMATPVILREIIAFPRSNLRGMKRVRVE